MTGLAKSVVGAMLVAAAAAAAWAAHSKTDLTARLWPKERIEEALRAVDQQKADGLLSDAAHARKRAMLEARRAGTFEPAMLATTDPPLNLLQNAGFEEVNRNSASNRSRWLWWGGWSWGGDYENRWEDRPDHVRSGQYSARITCKGQPGRIGINTPALPQLPGATAYVFTVWAKGEGENQLFLNFESGARGTLRQRVGPKWTEIALRGVPEPQAKTFSLYIYVTGAGTIWLDDARLVPEGLPEEESKAGPAPNAPTPTSAGKE